jgi:lysophospholipase L1-like esterase
MRRFHLVPDLRTVLSLLWAGGALAIGARLALAVILVMALPSRLAAASSTPTRYVALGDSLAWGDGASDPQTTGYVALLADYFAGMPHGGAKQLANLSVRGETTASFLDGQLAAAMAAIGDPTTDTRVVTLSLGGNDVGALLNDPSDICLADPAGAECRTLVAAALQGAADRFPVVVGSVMAALAADEGDERVFLMTVFNPFGGVGGPYEEAIDAVLLGVDLRIDCAAAATDPTSAGLNDIIACTGAALGATVVDAYPVIGDDALALTHIGEGTLDTHPNDMGYELLAKAHRVAS